MAAAPVSDRTPAVEMTTYNKSHADGDMHRTPAKEWTWIAIDAIGLVRNLAIAVAAGDYFAGLANRIGKVFPSGEVVSSVGKVCDVIVPVTQAIAGPLVIASAIFHVLPDFYNEYRAVEKDDENGKTIAALGLANGTCYLGMGGAITACGYTNPIVANTLHYTVQGSAPAAGIALGAIYTVRSFVILGRAYLISRDLDAFESDLQSKNTIDDAIEFLNQRRFNADNTEKNSFSRLIPLDKNSDGSLKFNNITKLSTRDEKIAYLKAVDKALYKKRLMQELSYIIGGAMLFGGVITILALTLFTGPFALAVIGLISGIAFSIMEYYYAKFDSTWLFNRELEDTYKESPHLRSLIGLVLQPQPVAVSAPTAVPTVPPVTVPIPGSYGRDDEERRRRERQLVVDSTMAAMPCVIL